jgi:hypothetical protein
MKCGAQLRTASARGFGSSMPATFNESVASAILG